ncbi:BLUF domain-containing protein [Sphingomonas swuensis]
MQFKYLAYTSLAALDMDEQQLIAIHDSARDLNGLDGITGLLIHNGTHFLQWIEGPPQAVDDLVERLRRDPRHSGFEVRDEGGAEERMFGHWSMNLVRVRSQVLLAREDVTQALPEALPPAIRDRIAAMVERISEDVAG